MQPLQLRLAAQGKASEVPGSSLPCEAPWGPLSDGFCFFMAWNYQNPWNLVDGGDIHGHTVWHHRRGHLGLALAYSWHSPGPPRMTIIMFATNGCHFGGANIIFCLWIAWYPSISLLLLAKSRKRIHVCWLNQQVPCYILLPNWEPSTTTIGMAQSRSSGGGNILLPRVGLAAIEHGQASCSELPP